MLRTRKIRNKKLTYLILTSLPSLSDPETGDSKWGFSDKNQLFSMWVFFFFACYWIVFSWYRSRSEPGSFLHTRKEPQTVHIKGKMWLERCDMQRNYLKSEFSWESIRPKEPWAAGHDQILHLSVKCNCIWVGRVFIAKVEGPDFTLNIFTRLHSLPYKHSTFHWLWHQTHLPTKSICLITKS